MLAELEFEHNMLGGAEPNAIEVRAAQETVRRFELHLKTIYAGFMQNQMNLFRDKVSQALLVLQNAQIRSDELDERLSDITQNVLNEVTRFLDQMMAYWPQKINELLTAETKPQKGGDTGNKMVGIVTAVAGSLFSLFEPRKKREIYQAVKENRPFQISNFPEYIEALIEKCAGIFKDVAAQIKEQAVFLCAHLVSFHSKWVSFSLSSQPTSCELFNVTCDTDGFLGALIAMCVRTMPSTKTLQDMHKGIPVGSEARDAIERRQTLEQEINKVRAARDGILLALGASGLEVTETQIEEWEEQAIDDDDQGPPSPLRRLGGS